MNKIVLILIFLIINTKEFTSQVELIVNHLTSCESDFKVKTDSSIKFPNSENRLHLPSNWNGKFEGELPSLKTSVTDEYKTFSVNATQAWNTFNRDELYEIIKKENPINKEFQYLNHNFLICKTDGAIGRYELYYHIDESKEFENRWMWKFVFGIRNIENNKNTICQFNMIIEQIVKEYEISEIDD